MKEWQVVNADDESDVYDSFASQKEAEECAQAISNLTGRKVRVQRISGAEATPE